MFCVHKCFRNFRNSWDSKDSSVMPKIESNPSVHILYQPAVSIVFDNVIHGSRCLTGSGHWQVIKSADTSWILIVLGSLDHCTICTLKSSQTVTQTVTPISSDHSSSGLLDLSWSYRAFALTALLHALEPLLQCTSPREDSSPNGVLEISSNSKCIMAKGNEVLLSLVVNSGFKHQTTDSAACLPWFCRVPVLIIVNANAI